MNDALFDRLLDALLTHDPAQKCAALTHLHADWLQGSLSLESKHPVQALPIPGRPTRPVLVDPRQVPKRNKLHTLAGRAALLHALAHIEFNAINLAMDAAYRFREMPRDYYHDWLRVAAEEALHFNLLAQHLATLGYGYGDFPAHNGLWQMAIDTAHDPLLRMALVPRVLEARGLDVAPGLIARLAQTGDSGAVDILRVICRDEITHVEIGSRWYTWLCAQRGLDPDSTFFTLVQVHLQGRLKGPFNLEDRAKAGFSAAELGVLQAME